MSSLKKGFGLYTKKIEHEAELQSKFVMNILLKTVKRLTPVRTGFLRASWKLIKHKRLHWSLVNKAPYAAAVEHGAGHHNRGIKGRHMLKRALQQTKAIRLGEKAAIGAAAAKKRN